MPSLRSLRSRRLLFRIPVLEGYSWCRRRSGLSRPQRISQSLAGSDGMSPKQMNDLARDGPKRPRRRRWLGRSNVHPTVGLRRAPFTRKRKPRDPNSCSEPPIRYRVRLGSIISPADRTAERELPGILRPLDLYHGALPPESSRGFRHRKLRRGQGRTCA